MTEPDAAPDLAALAPDLSADQLREAYTVLVRCRVMEAKGWELVRQNRVHFALAAAGHEGAALGYALAVDRDTDYLAVHYRDAAALLHLGVEPVAFLSTLYGKATGVSRGRQPYGYWGTARLRVLSGSGPQPNHLTHGVGVAFASKYLSRPEVTWVSFGDGGASRGEFHEGLNFAAIHDLPVVFVCQNNGYTQSVPLRLESAHADIARRAHGYDIPGVSVDGMDLLAVYRAARQARARAVDGGGPTLLELKTYRYLANTSNDDDTKYRSRAEIDLWTARDPITTFAATLIAAGVLGSDAPEQIEQAARDEIADALRQAQDAPYADSSEVYEHTYAEPCTAEVIRT